MKELCEYPTLLAKMHLLTYGVDVNTEKVKECFPEFHEKFRSIGKRMKVSDRAFLSPKATERLYIPDELLIDGNDGTSVVKTYYVSSSPYCLTVNEDNEFIIKKKQPDERLRGVKISPIPSAGYSKEVFPDGASYSDYISLVGVDRVTTIPFGGCFNWVTGHPCLFCGCNPRRFRSKTTDTKLDVEDALQCLRKGYDYDMWWKSCKGDYEKRVKESAKSLLKTDYPKPHFHFLITGGNFPNLDFGWKMTFHLFDSLQEVIELNKVDALMNLMPPYDLSLIKDMKDEYGVRKVSFNLEVWTEEYFRKVCPGKEISYGYDNMIKALLSSVETLGEGNVRCNFVLGAQPSRKMLHGAHWLAKRGVVPDISIFFPRPSSRWKRKQPPSEKVVFDSTMELVKIYKEYDYSPIYCRLSSRSSLANELFEISK